MMTGNPLSGHTNHNMTLSGTAQPVDGLADGDHITSPTLTNLLEGIHGNGIILEEDTAKTASNRLQPENLPGICERTGNNTFSVKGGLAVLDGLIYTFAGGVGSSATYIITQATTEGSNTPLSSGQEALVVVYLSANSGTNHVKMEMGTASTVSTNLYPTTPHAFLNNPSGTSNDQSVVLCVLRVVYSGSGGDLNVNITEVNDKRIFIRNSPIYFTPLTTNNVGDPQAIDSHTDLDAFHTGTGTGSFSATRLGGLWLSYGSQLSSTTAGDLFKNVLYFSGSSGGRYTRSVFDRVLTTASTSLTISSADANILILTARSGTCAISTTGVFPTGYIVEIKNQDTGDTATFAGETIAASGYGRFVCTTGGTSPTFVRLI
tara:strand:- start:8530 stop:9657 length:1128 start_codon:yes stop_codon:yes gene_type:complete